MTWANAAFMGVDALGSALNARNSYKNTVSSVNEMVRVERANLVRALQAAEANRQAQMQALLAQQAVADAERGRQQEFARGQRDVVDANVGMFGNFGGQMDGKAGAIAQTIMDFIAANPGSAQAPAARNEAVANREAAMRAQSAAEVGTDVRNGANVQAMGELMGDIGVGMGRNNELGMLLGNFAGGSAQAMGPEMDAARMWFRQSPIEERFVQPAGRVSYLGDLLKLGGQMGANGAFNGMFQPSPYALMAPGESFNRTGLQMPKAPNLDYMGGGQGVRLGGGNTGLVLSSNLGIR
jgi:hypothetical protein